jgi:hypothetical protein
MNETLMRKASRTRGMSEVFHISRKSPVRHSGIARRIANPLFACCVSRSFDV